MCTPPNARLRARTGRSVPRAQVQASCVGVDVGWGVVAGVIVDLDAGGGLGAGAGLWVGGKLGGRVIRLYMSPSL